MTIEEAVKALLPAVRQKWNEIGYDIEPMLDRSKGRKDMNIQVVDAIINGAFSPLIPQEDEIFETHSYTDVRQALADACSFV